MATVKVKELTSFWELAKGLMFEIKPQPVSFRTRWGIHTFFMNFPIDVVILNSDDKIEEIFINLKPWRIRTWNPRFNRVLELPSGTVKKMQLRVGDLLKTNIYKSQIMR